MKLNPKILALGIALGFSSFAHAQFVPIPLTSGTFNFDMIVESNAPPEPFFSITASMGGTNKSDNAWYEKGFNTGSLTTGLPVHGSTFTNASNAGITFTMPPDYSTNDCFFVDTTVPTATLTPTVSPTVTNLSFLTVSGGGPVGINYTINHVDASVETGSFSAPDWFGSGTMAQLIGGRVTPAGGISTSSSIKIWSTNVTVSGGSAISNIVFNWASGGRGVVFAVSGNSGGTNWTPIPVTGYNQDLIVEAGKGTTATMDGGTNNNANTFYEVGYDRNALTTGIPVHGTILTSTNKPDHSYQMPATYAGNNAVFVDATLTNANVTPVTPQFYTGLSFLSAAANANVSPIVIRSIIQYQNGSAETNTFNGKDWFNGTPAAYTVNGRLSVDNRTFNNVNANNPRLYEAEFLLHTIGSPVTNVAFQFVSGQSGSRIAVFAMSGSTNAVSAIYTSQPVPTNGFPGGSVSLSGSAVGSPAPTYQWQRGTNGVYVNLADGGNIAGSGTSNLVVSALSSTDDADYRMLAINAAGSIPSTVVHVTVLSTLSDVTATTDPIVAYQPNGGSSPVNEGPAHAIDNNTSKFLNFGTNVTTGGGSYGGSGPIGFVVTPAAGSTIVSGLRLYTAGDAVERDPADYTLEGSTDGVSYVTISSGPLALPDARNASPLALDPTSQALQQVMFNNPVGFTSYRLSFSTVKNSVAANSLQIGEVEFLGIINPVQPPPVITVQPQALTTVFVNGGVSLSVTATGQPPLSYQWSFGANPILNATNSTLVLSGLQLTDAGNYSVTVSTPNSPTSTTSANAVVSVIATPTNAYPSVVMADAPIAYFRLDESNIVTGTVAVDYAGGHNGIYTNVTGGQAGYDSFVDPDTAALFGGTTPSMVGGISGIDFSQGGTALNAEFSVEAWISASPQTNDNGIVTFGAGGGGEQFDLDGFGNADGTGNGPPGLSFRFFGRDATGGSGAHQVDGTTVAFDGTYHHVVGTFDEAGGAVTLYIDGVPAGTNAPGTSGPPVAGTGLFHPPASQFMSIGSRQSGAGTGYNDQFVGTIDEVALYNYVLTANQVSNHFAAGTIPPTVTVTETKDGAGNVVLTWSPAVGTLQSSTDVTTGYTDISPVPTSPYTNAITSTNTYFRVRVK